MIDVIDLFNACVYIQDHLEADLSLLFLAQTAGLSRFRFHRVFKAWRGETLHDFVTRMRMERAAFELAYPIPRSSRRSVKAIAFASGYKSLSSFSHAFSSYAHLSPREYRNRALQSRPPVAPGATGLERLGRFRITVREEPARQVAIFDPVIRAGEVSGPAGGSALLAQQAIPGTRYGIESLPNLYVRGERASPAMRPTRFPCVGVSLDDWQRAVPARTRADARPRTTITLDGGRYAVVEGHGSIPQVYRAWRRGFDQWLAASGECPRSARTYVRFETAPSASDGVNPPIALYIPLERVPVLHPPRDRKRKTAILQEATARKGERTARPTSGELAVGAAGSTGTES